MLLYPDKKRYTAEQAFSHTWIQSECKDNIDPEAIKDVMKNLNNFHVFSIYILG